jgi:multiple sugar transport system permease protein
MVFVSTSVSRRRPRHKVRKHFGGLVAYLALVLGAALFSVPFFWMLSTSLKTMGEVFRFPPQWLPGRLRFENYVAVWKYLPMGRFVLNTGIITGLSTVGYLFSCSLSAFAFSRLRFRGRDFLFTLLLATMMLPSQVTLIPQFVAFQKLGWINTFLPLVVPSFFGSAFYIFLLRQFFMTLPRELDESALIDGASTFQIFWHIILPLGKPALATVAVFSFIRNWNDFFRPLIYLTSPDKMTLAVGLQLLHGRFYSEYNTLMAASTIAILPVFVVFFLAQKTFVQGIALTGLKG